MARKITTVVRLEAGTNLTKVREWIETELEDMEYDFSFFFEMVQDEQGHYNNLHFMVAQDAYDFDENYKG
jgi:predicted DNA-binding protein